MNKFLITTWTFTTVLVLDTEFDGVDIVIGVYDAEDEHVAKYKACKEHNVPIDSLTAYKIV